VRIANLAARLVLVTPDGTGALDVERASQGRFAADPQAVYERWAEFTGDVIFTGTPSGVGLGRSPQVWLAPGDELVSYVAGIGELRQRFVAAPRG
jgi:Fumarylacetoacetate (FAA) hydrolase family